MAVVDTSNDPRVRELRRCHKCTQPQVTVVHVTQHLRGGMSTGRTYLHRCAGCKAEFRSISLWRALRSFFSAGVMIVVGFFFVSLFFSTLFAMGTDLFAQADGRMWGTWGVGALIFFGGLAWACWTTWLVTRLMILNPIANSR